VAISDLKQTYALTDLMVVPVDVGSINRHFHTLELKARKDLSSWGVTKGGLALIRSVDMRYRRQVHEVNVPVMGGNLTEKDLDEIDRRFEEKYESIYGKGAAFREAGVEMVTFRVDAVGYMQRPKLKKYPAEGPSAESALVGHRQVLFQGQSGFTKTNIYDGDRLKSGNVIEGPAIIEYPGTTVSVNPGQRAGLDQYLNIAIEGA
jgi:N-methylhydantoinase A